MNGGEAKADKEAGHKNATERERATLSQNKILGIVLGVLCVVIVGLVIGVVAANIWKNNPEVAVERRADVILETQGICGEAENRYLNEGASLGDVTASLNEALANEDAPMYQVWLSVCYANFLASYSANLDAAFSVLGNVEYEIANVDNTTAATYYTAYRDLYETVGDGAMVEYYDQIINEYLTGEAIYEE